MTFPYSNPPPPAPASTPGQLWKRILSKMSVRISLVIFLASGASYWHIATILKKEALHTLEKYIHERGEKEQSTFTQVAKNHAFYLSEVRHTLSKLTEKDKAALTAKFKSITELNAAGVRRRIRKGHDGTRMSGVYIGNNHPHPESNFPLYQLLHQTTEDYGLAYSTSYMDFYATTPDNILIGYSPTMPTWTFDAKDDFDVSKEDWVQLGLKARNPKRITAYTGAYFDIPGQLWMVTATTPYDNEAGRHLFNIGTDITIDEIFQRTLNDHLEGAFNFLVAKDGTLVADKGRMEEIRKRGGSYNLLESKDPSDRPLQQILKAILDEQVDSSRVIDDPKLDDLLAVYQLKGPDWFFVTAYAKSNITRSARNVILFILGLSLLSLLAELVVMFGVINTAVKSPIEKFLEAVKQISSGDYSKRVTLNTQDELAELATNFNSMIEVINERDRTLEAKVQERTRQLAEKNRDIEAILNNISQGIFTLSLHSPTHSPNSPSSENNDDSPCIDPNHSRHLEEIFQLKPIVGVSLQTLTETRFNLPSEQLKTMLDVVTSCFGNDRINWEMNSHLLPHEINYGDVKERLKQLEFDWDVICNERDEVARVMVAVRDVTELRKLQESARKQKEDLERIGQTIQVGFSKMQTFIESSKIHLATTKECLTGKTSDPNALMRALHTIKGNARTLRLNRISNLAHDCEKAVLASEGSANCSNLIELLEGEVELYSTTLNGLAAFSGEQAPVRGPEFAGLDSLLKGSLESGVLVATDLGKPIPKIQFSDSGLLFKSELKSLLSDVLMHLVRNSIDHGIESPQERVAANKLQEGRLSIQSSLSQNGSALIRYSDDGRGIHLKRLREKLGIGPRENISDLEIAEHIFDAGLSTAERVTDISGRGVGMDAVREFLAQIGAQIKILLSSGKEGDPYRSAVFEISIPKEFVQS